MEGELVQVIGVVLFALLPGGAAVLRYRLRAIRPRRFTPRNLVD